MNENKVKVWIARDKNGELNMYNVRPGKLHESWWGGFRNGTKCVVNYFPSVKWEDSEPTEAYITLANEPQPAKEIDWEQRRYEIARELISSFATKANTTDFVRQEEIYSDFAIHIADTLIKELKTYHK